MNLNKSIVFICVSIFYSIILKFGWALFPHIFSSMLVIKTVSVLSFLSGLAVIVFAIYFIKEVNVRNSKKFNVLVLLALLGPAYYMFKHFVELIFLFNNLSLKLYDFSPDLHLLISIYNVNSNSQVIFWLGSVFMISLYYVLYKSIKLDMVSFKRAIGLVLIGTILTATIRSFGFFVYLFYPDLVFFHNPSPLIYLISFTIFLFTSLLSLNFFLRLYRIENRAVIFNI